MPSFGEKLKAAREDRGIELAAVSAATNVGIHLLEALEANEFKRLPGGPFNKGFVRAFARHIGIDPDEAISAYTREERSQGIRTPDVEHESPDAKTRLAEFRDDGDQITLVLDWVMVKRSLMATGALLLMLTAAWLLWPASNPGLTENEQPASSSSRPVAATDDRSETEDDTPENSQAATPAARPPAVTDSPAGDTPPDRSTTRREPAPASPATQPAASQPRSRPEPTLESTASSLDVMDFGVGTGVSQRQLTGRSDHFPVGTKVWFWTRTLGGSKGEILEHVWLREGQPVITYTRTLGGPHWRNSSRKTLGPGSQGRWTVEARDVSGRVVARTSFACTPE